MMIRISRPPRRDGRRGLRIEGRLTHHTVEELRMECQTLSQVEGPLELDVSGLQFADAAGVTLLRSLEDAGARIHGRSALLDELLRAPESVPGSAPEAPPPADAPDHDLVTALRSGDPRAFETLVRRYGGRMLATARRMMVVEDDAHDVVQEAFLSAFRSIESFAGTARLSTWLHRIVVNAALMKLRSRRRRPEESIDALLPRFDDSGHFAEPVARWEGGGVARLERQETRLAVRAAIDRLPDNYRTVLLLRDIEELDTEETAARLALTPSIVKMRLHRARQALRALITRDFEQEIPPADGGGRLRRRASAVA
jgi:RNA polymerase sigma-70 factor (ECF subfamily)